jgi:hypothetical protein
MLRPRNIIMFKPILKGCKKNPSSAVLLHLIPLVMDILNNGVFGEEKAENKHIVSRPRFQEKPETSHTTYAGPL